MGLLDKLLAGKTPTRDDFASVVIKALSQAGVQNIVYDKAQFLLKCGGSEGTMFLHNSFENYCKANRKEREAILVRLGSAFSSVPEIPEDFRSAAPFLMPVIKDASYACLSELSLRAKQMDVSNMECPTKPLFGSLVVGLAYDTEHSIQQLNQTALDPWGVSFEEAFKVAKDNLRDKTDPNGMVQVAPDVYQSQWEDSYDSARILLTDLIYRLSLSGDPVALVPNRNQLWIAGSRNPTALSTLLKVAEVAHFEPYPISPGLFLLNDGAWSEYVSEDAAFHKQTNSLQRRREAMDYQQQKESLNAIHEVENIDIFVASYNVYQQKDGAEYSACVWTRDVDSLLPKTERIFFLVDKDAKDPVMATWETALSVVGELMEEEPGMQPQRYRVRSFPAEEQIARLREVALEMPD